MSEIEIFVDPDNPSHDELAAGLRRSLKELPSITVKEERRPVPSGTLSAGLDEVVAYVIQNPDKVLPLLAALLNTISNLVRFRSSRGEKGRKDKPVVVVVRNERLMLPASESTQKKFLQRVQASEQKLERGEKGTHTSRKRRNRSGSK